MWLDIRSCSSVRSYFTPRYAPEIKTFRAALASVRLIYSIRSFACSPRLEKVQVSPIFTPTRHLLCSVVKSQLLDSAKLSYWRAGCDARIIENVYIICGVFFLAARDACAAVESFIPPAFLAAIREWLALKFHSRRPCSIRYSRCFSSSARECLLRYHEVPVLHSLSIFKITSLDEFMGLSSLFPERDREFCKLIFLFKLFHQFSKSTSNYLPTYKSVVRWKI